jgi:hypothetical protein
MRNRRVRGANDKQMQLEYKCKITRLKAESAMLRVFTGNEHHVAIEQALEKAKGEAKEEKAEEKAMEKAMSGFRTGPCSTLTQQRPLSPASPRSRGDMGVHSIMGCTLQQSPHL